MRCTDTISRASSSIQEIQATWIHHLARTKFLMMSAASLTHETSFSAAPTGQFNDIRVLKRQAASAVDPKGDGSEGKTEKTGRMNEVLTSQPG